MKKFIVCSLVLISAVPALASDMIRPAGGYYETKTNNCEPVAMRHALDNATAARRAVITVVRCGDQAKAPSRPMPRVAVRQMPCDTCGNVIERVVDRRYYVEETVEQYRPVVHYVPAGGYTRHRHVCTECGM